MANPGSLTIPEFPDSREITVADKPLFDSIFAAAPPEVSAYTFTNIFAWRNAYSSTVSRLGDYVLVLSDHGDRLACFQPLFVDGTGDDLPSRLPYVADEILRRSPRPVHFERLPTEAALVLEAAGLQIESDRGNWDYLYSANDLITLAGRNYSAKRNQLSHAKARIDYEYVRMDADIADHCQEFACRWCLERNCDTVEGLRREKCAVYEMLTNFDVLGIEGGAIRSNGEILAFSFGEALNPETLVVHAEKADGSIDGLYQLINQEFCIAHAGDFRYVNREQDLGIPGLRKAKESYHPVRMIEVFTARA